MGLNALDPADWLWRDEHFGPRDCRAPAAPRRGGRRRCWPSCREAAAAVTELIAGPRPFRPAARAPGALADLAGLAQEDFCVLQKRDDGQLCADRRDLVLSGPLAAGREDRPSICARSTRRCRASPTRLAGPADRFFANLTVARPVCRANWSVVESPELFHPQPRVPVPGLTAENAGEQLWLRVERQTCAACRRAARSCSPSAPWSARSPRSPPIRPWPAPWPHACASSSPAWPATRG